jgi:hypothetical protein
LGPLEALEVWTRKDLEGMEAWRTYRPERPGGFMASEVWSLGGLGVLKASFS